MKKVGRILVKAVVTVLVILLLAILALGIFADIALKKAVEVAGSAALKVNVAVSGVDISLSRGHLALEGLTIDNPKGYAHDKLLQLLVGDVTFNVKSLLTDTVEIQRIKLDGIDMVIEQKGLSSNLQEVINSLPRSDGIKTPESSGKKLRIGVLEITNVVIQARFLPTAGKDNAVTIRLAPIRLTDLGKDNRLDTSALTEKILVAIAEGLFNGRSTSCRP